jgi:ubiquinone/menaquinone biosynthesis C-methylase UbiE
MNASTTASGALEIKQCCAQLYESDIAKLLLGDSFHPGGLKLTERLGELLQLAPKSRVLDVASGTGASALFLARHFGCQVVGIDFGDQNVLRANDAAVRQDLAALVQFQRSDAERLSFVDASFDAVICECAFCTFPDKPAAAHEISRVLKPGGTLGLSDLTRAPVLGDSLQGLLAWIACIADAQDAERYAAYLRGAGFASIRVEPHNEALVEMAAQIRMKLLGAEIMVGRKKVNLPEVDFARAKELLKVSLEAIQAGQLGYAILTASRPT